MWRQHNPYDLAGRLAGVRLHVSSGDGTPGPYDAGAAADVLETLACTVSREFAGKLGRLGIPVTTHFYRGTHTSPYCGVSCARRCPPCWPRSPDGRLGSERGRTSF